jgi:DNA-directed RNA polymerase subunit M/transcription elongation factor TFIIS
MKFCKACERLLILRETTEGKKVFLCPNCKKVFKAEGNLGLTTKEEVETKEEVGAGVAKKEKGIQGHDFKCKKCGNKSYEITDLGIMYGDEDWIYLMKCTNCGFTERVGDYC